MTKIRTYIKLCKGRRVLTQYVQKKIVNIYYNSTPIILYILMFGFFLHRLCQNPVLMKVLTFQSVLLI